MTMCNKHAEHCKVIKCDTFQCQLEGLPWFSQRRSPMQHFEGAHPGGYDPKFELGRGLCTMRLPPSFIILCLLVRKLSCWQTNKQTNRRRWKHPTLFATLRRWVIMRCSRHWLVNLLVYLYISGALTWRRSSLLKHAGISDDFCGLCLAVSSASLRPCRHTVATPTPAPPRPR